MTKKAIIIGAGPAGLTAAYELLKRTDIKPIIFEKSGDIGGISKTVNYKGNRIDIGGHRFFSKSDRVMNWWFNIMPVASTDETFSLITYQRNHRTIKQEKKNLSTSNNNVMLLRKRLSRIYFLRKFFTYPIQLSIETLSKLGAARTISILTSYTKAQLFKRKPEKSLEDFLINRFGDKLYQLFFKDYTEKVWGVPCDQISAEWGAQRIKGLSIIKAIQHAMHTMVKKKSSGDISQKGTETSLIEQFLYPALGPGQLWEEVARQVKQMGGEIHMHESVKNIFIEDNVVKRVVTENSITKELNEQFGDYFFSTMPVKELISGMEAQIPEDVLRVAAGLQYRDFITVGVLLKKLSPPDSNDEHKILPDTWIYIQEKDVKVGRLQIFNNWSPFMVKDPNTVWVGMEYFCNTNDDFWNLSDSEIQRIGICELEKMGLAKIEDVLDSTVLRMEKTYPAYFGTYNEFDKIRNYLDQIENLFLVGRNGMHKYNNSDHSMLTAMVSVDNIIDGITSKTNIWSINTEQEYHEEKEKSISENVLEQKLPVNPDLVPNLEAESFQNYLFKNKNNRAYLILATISLILQFCIFKYLYPFASFINGDSYVYLESAERNLSINTYPIGYSMFLRLFSIISKSDTALIAFQYFSLFGSILGFLFTTFFFYKPNKIVQISLLIFMIFNPVFLYLANYVSSDTIFLSLSLIWLTLLLWIAHKPSTKLIIWHGIVLFVAFTVRYNALFYPLITGLAFWLSKQQVWKKMLGPAFGLTLIVLFIIHSGNQYKKLTGSWQFTPFTGWQMANNAMYAYRYVDSAKRKPVPEKFQKLDKMITTYFDTTRNIERFPTEKMMAGTVYMWTPRMPLQKYMTMQFKNDTASTKLKRWASMGPLYSEYGNYLIRQYPITFLKYYIWPNTIKYYSPPVEFLEQYSTGRDSVNKTAQSWFEYKSRKITNRVGTFKVDFLRFLPILAGSLNIIYLFGLTAYILLQGYKQQKELRKGLIIATGLWLINFGFSIYASPISLRLQLFSIIVSIVFASFYLEFLIKTALTQEPNIRPNSINNVQLTN